MAKVLITIGYPIGDCIAAMPYIDKYVRESGDQTLVMLGNPNLKFLFRKSYPAIVFVDWIPGEVERVINLMYSFDKPIQLNFAEQLGFKYAPYIRPKVDRVNGPRPIKNRYAVIGMHSTSQLKYWNHPGGKAVMLESPNWNDLSDMLRKVGITPVVMEKDELFGRPPYYNGLPKKSQKKINRPIPEVMNHIEHAEFYIGLSSGFSWLAHALGQKVAMIANFTEEWHEIGIGEPDYVRITNSNSCHGCWNRAGKDFPFVHDDWFWCPLRKDTPRQFECHTSITPEMVFEAIRKWV